MFFLGSGTVYFACPVVVFPTALLYDWMVRLFPKGISNSGSGALSGKMLLVGIVINIKIYVFFRAG